MRRWTLQKINELWVLQDDTDRERQEHRVYGMDWELGQFLVEAANAWEQENAPERPLSPRMQAIMNEKGPIPADMGNKLRINRIASIDATGVDAEVLPFP